MMDVEQSPIEVGTRFVQSTTSGLMLDVSVNRLHVR